MNATEHGMPLEQARLLARRLASTLEPGCERIEVAGSIRRGKALVNDIELVCIPKPSGRLDALLLALEREGIGGRRIYRSRAYLEEALASQGKPFVHAPDVVRVPARAGPGAVGGDAPCATAGFAG